MKASSIAFILFLSLSCKQNPVDAQNVVQVDKFAKTFKLKPKPFKAFDHGLIVKMYFNDSVLICRLASANTSSKYVYFYDLKNSAAIDSGFTAGGKSNQVISPLSSDVNERFFYVYDMGTSKISILPKENYFNQKGAKHQETRLSKSFSGVAVDTNGHYYAAGDFTSPLKISKYDLHTNKLIKKFGTYYDCPPDQDSIVWRYATRGQIFLQPSQKHLVYRTIFSNQIEIFDLEKQTSKVIRGPGKLDPKFKAFNGPDGKMGVITDFTHFGYTGGIATNKFIYLLYAGTPIATPTVDWGKTIHVFDWEGNAVKTYTLPNYVSTFTIDNDKTAYFYDTKTNQITYAKLD